MSNLERAVAVVIPAKDAAATVGRAVASALAQPEAAEVLVIDDGSTDATAERALEAGSGSDRLCVRSLPRSVGPAAARNLALSVSVSPWLCPLDADDFFQPGRLRRLLDAADGCDFVADDILMVQEGDEDGAARRVIGEREALPLLLTFPTFVEANISRPGMPRREYGFLKPLMRRSFLETAGLTYDEGLRLGEDFILYASALARGAVFKVVGPCGYVAVERAGSLSAQHTKRDLESLLAASADMDLDGLGPRERLAARRHQQHLRAKIHLREVLDARREGGLARGLLAIVERAPSASYILARLIEDKWLSAHAQRRPHGAEFAGRAT